MKLTPSHLLLYVGLVYVWHVGYVPKIIKFCIFIHFVTSKLNCKIVSFNLGHSRISTYGSYRDGEIDSSRIWFVWQV